MDLNKKVIFYLIPLSLISISSLSGVYGRNRNVICPDPVKKIIEKDPNFCSNVKCDLGLTPMSCPDGTTYAKELTMCGCCPGCGNFITHKSMDPIGFCDLVREPAYQANCPEEGICPVETFKCEPGLKCNEGLCEEPDPDEEFLCTYRKWLKSKDLLHWDPECEGDGTFAPKQCKGLPSTGTCFCVDKKGNRIFGAELWVNADEGKMNCGCSRRVHELRANGYIASFHCTSNGNFEPLQCDIESGLCFCVESVTGSLTGALLPENQWKKLPCFRAEDLPGFSEDAHYLRRCDSQWAVDRKMDIEAELHGLKLRSTSSLVCDYDGSFAARQTNYNQAGQEECVFKDGIRTEYFRQETTENPMNCNCARDSVWFTELGIPFPHMCEMQTGNYRPAGIYGNAAMCVDKDGFTYNPFTNEVPTSLICCLDNTCNASIRPECERLGFISCRTIEHKPIQ